MCTAADLHMAVWMYQLGYVFHGSRSYVSYPAIGQLFQWVTDLEKHGPEPHISEHASEVRVARVLYIHSYIHM